MWAGTGEGGDPGDREAGVHYRGRMRRHWEWKSLCRGGEPGERRAKGVSLFRGCEKEAKCKEVPTGTTTSLSQRAEAQW